MLKRYRTTEAGVATVAANIYLVNEHGIRRTVVDAGAARVCERLIRVGHEAYIVGGALRDLLTGYTPNDFDIATSARPRQIASLFRGSRIIGRRFKLVHVPMGSQIFEVSTFRAADRTASNGYGTVDQDALRRDFTFNALYFSPRTERIIDYVGGYNDIKRRELKTVIAPEISFAEDPVRMIRAIKYTNLVRFSMDRHYRGLIGANAGLIADCSVERLTDELVKILGSGEATAILDVVHRLGLFEKLLPKISQTIRLRLRTSRLGIRLSQLDQRVVSRTIPIQEMKIEMFCALLGDLPFVDPSWTLEVPSERELSQQLRNFMKPLVLPQNDAVRIAKILVTSI